MNQKLRTDELHQYGFISILRSISSPLSAADPISFYPDWVFRGDEVILLPLDKVLTPPACFDDKDLRRGRLVGIKEGEIFVSMHDEKETYDDMCFAFDNTKQ